VSGIIKPGDSAIFMLVETHDPEFVAEYFRGTGGEIIRTNLTLAELERVQQILTGTYYADMLDREGKLLEVQEACLTSETVDADR
jgi:uncharacterized membrane protein